ncbi:MAG: hypothetical protein QOI31_1851 [Solirubrobacterales bacterium]|jgi:hypothetical protein|nr:hypothetical protein [Solirubrobacterales bacterium]
MFDVMIQKAYIGVATVAVLAALTSTPASATMQSVQISDKVCQTTGGGKFVDIPGFPGEKIDRRLLNDIKYLRRKYQIFITDGYSNDPAHSANGEHPIGLALDIVPDFAAGGDWNDIDRLAAWAEPSQNQPRSPFRWVGYNGDAGHGRGHHLHLSYSHSTTKPGKPANTMYSLRCPNSGGGGGDNEPDRDNDGGGSGGGGGNGGGIKPGGGGGGGGNGGDGDGGGGISPRSFDPGPLAPIHPETGGVDG